MVRGTKKKVLQGISLVILLVIIYYPAYRRIQEVKARQDKLKQELEALEKENAGLQKKLEMLEKDMVYIEKRAREKLGLVEEGEIIYEFVPSQSEAESRGGAVR